MKLKGLITNSAIIKIINSKKKKRTHYLKLMNSSKTSTMQLNPRITSSWCPHWFHSELLEIALAVAIIPQHH
jgi:hypothetical protein